MLMDLLWSRSRLTQCRVRFSLAPTRVWCRAIELDLLVMLNVHLFGALRKCFPSVGREERLLWHLGVKWWLINWIWRMFLWFWISGKLLFCIGIFIIFTDLFLLREECLSLRSFLVVVQGSLGLWWCLVLGFPWKTCLEFVGFIMRWWWCWKGLTVHVSEFEVIISCQGGKKFIMKFIESVFMCHPSYKTFQFLGNNWREVVHLPFPFVFSSWAFGVKFFWIIVRTVIDVMVWYCLYSIHWHSWWNWSGPVNLRIVWKMSWSCCWNFSLDLKKESCSVSLIGVSGMLVGVLMLKL